jgi:hypothetical protein
MNAGSIAVIDKKYFYSLGLGTATNNNNDNKVLYSGRMHPVACVTTNR